MVFCARLGQTSPSSRRPGHTLLLQIPQPVVPSSALDDISIAISDLAPISESHRDIEFVPPPAPPRHKRFKIRRKPVPGGVPPTDSDSSSISSVGDIIEAPRQHAHPAISHADLVATQEFLAASGRIVSLQELAYFLFDGPASSDAPPLGLQATQIETALAFLRPHPFAPSARRRVLVMVLRGQLALEGLALMACYLAYAERCSVRFALRKFERSVGTVSKAWRGLLGNDGVIAAYLEELLLATQEAI
ncbi:hypothetical protein FB451DRAFT_1472734 [Mycena latifolia]|nr:hypothetical protein FB451DRAFT_1472734 [Mycena latifolia]